MVLRIRCTRFRISNAVGRCDPCSRNIDAVKLEFALIKPDAILDIPISEFICAE